MHAHAGDLIVVDSQGVGRATRHGRVEEILGSAEGTHYLVRWSDGQQTFYYPGADGHVIDSSGLAHSDSSALMVFDGYQLTGIVAERDIVRALAAGADPDEVCAADVAPEDLVWASPDDSIVQAADVMNQRGIHHLPVGGDGTLAGVVSAGDVLAAVVGNRPA